MIHKLRESLFSTDIVFNFITNSNKTLKCPKQQKQKNEAKKLWKIKEMETETNKEKQQQKSTKKLNANNS